MDIRPPKVIANVFSASFQRMVHFFREDGELREARWAWNDALRKYRHQMWRLHPFTWWEESIVVNQGYLPHLQAFIAVLTSKGYATGYYDPEVQRIHAELAKAIEHVEKQQAGRRRSW